MDSLERRTTARAGSAERMSKIWLPSARSCCVHPGRPPVNGRLGCLGMSWGILGHLGVGVWQNNAKYEEDMIKHIERIPGYMIQNDPRWRFGKGQVWHDKPWGC